MTINREANVGKRFARHVIFEQTRPCAVQLQVYGEKEALLLACKDPARLRMPCHLAMHDGKRRNAVEQGRDREAVECDGCGRA